MPVEQVFEEPEAPVEENPFDKFSPEVRDAVEGLAHLGHLTRTVEFCGHTFGLRTLRPNEQLAVANAMQPWRGTLREPEAWSWAHVGMALTSIDGDPAFCPQAGPDLEAFARARLAYVTGPKGFFDPTLNFLWVQFQDLEAEATRAINEIANLSKRSLPTRLPSVGSLIGPAPSPEPTNGETPSSDPSRFSFSLD